MATTSNMAAWSHIYTQGGFCVTRPSSLESNSTQKSTVLPRVALPALQATRIVNAATLQVLGLFAWPLNDGQGEVRLPSY